MNKYELEKTLDMMEVITKLVVGHLPEIYTRDIIREVIKSKNMIKEDIKLLK